MTVKLRDMVSLSFLVHSKTVPDVVQLKRQSLPYVGNDPSAPGQFITGIYGAHSKQTALVASSKWAMERAGSSSVSQVFMLDTNYRVDNYSLTREQTRPDTLEKTGWLHLDRVASDFREVIKAQWLAWIAKESGPIVSSRLSDLSLADIALKHPQCVALMFEANPNIRGIVHPVNPVLDPSVTLWVATVRYEKERFHGPTIRYLPYITVEI